jgi:hypothetical protein
VLELAYSTSSNLVARKGLRVQLPSSAPIRSIRKDMKWNNEQLSEAVKTSTSYRQVLKKLGLTGAGGNYDNIPRQDDFTGA